MSGRARRIAERGGVVISRDLRHFADGPGVDPFHHLHVGRGAADLEPDIETQPPLRFLAQFLDAFGAAHVHASGLFAVAVLARGDHRCQVLGMEKVRRGDVNGVDLLALGNGLEGLGAFEHELGIDAGMAFLGGDAVKVLLAFIELVAEQVAQRHIAGVRVLRHHRGHVRAPPAAAQQAQAQRRVGRRATHRLGLDDHYPRRGRRRTHEFAAPDFLRLVRHSFSLLYWSDRPLRSPCRGSPP